MSESVDTVDIFFIYICFFGSGRSHWACRQLCFLDFYPLLFAEGTKRLSVNELSL